MYRLIALLPVMVDMELHSHGIAHIFLKMYYIFLYT